MESPIMKLLLFCLPILLETYYVSADCDPVSRCHCHITPDTINCTYIAKMIEHPTMADIQRIGSDNPGVKTVIFNGFTLPNIAINLLGLNKHPNLDTLDLSNNNIETIHPGAFHHMPNLKHLILDDNNWRLENSSDHPRLFNHSNFITMSLNNAFAPRAIEPTFNRSTLLEQIFENSTMVSLENLYLRDNDLYGLPPDFFVNMPNLKILDMSDNRLLRVNFNITSLLKLTELHLTFNTMEVINEELLDDITVLATTGSLKSVFLAGNPVNCDCKALPFYNWTASGNGSVVADKAEILCGAAAEDKWVGTPLMDLKREQLVCKALPNNKSQFIILGVVLGLVGVVALVVLWLNRKIFIKKYQSCKETLSSKHSFSIYSSKYSSVVS